jgi:hypothetical protein
MVVLQRLTESRRLLHFPYPIEPATPATAPTTNQTHPGVVAGTGFPVGVGGVFGCGGTGNGLIASPGLTVRMAGVVGENCGGADGSVTQLIH